VLEVGLVGGGAQLQEGLYVGQVGVAVAGVIVDDLVVVPDQEPGVGGVAGTQVGVELVAGVVDAVVGQGEVGLVAGEAVRVRPTGLVWPPASKR
jgi:hypothetical protein